jgi:aryl-alcohol dehydrogenase-like predicted oxidoreductase
MEQILLGKTGLSVSRLGFGCSHIASLAGRHSPHEVAATLEEAVAEGVNFFDTADVYGQGDSERMLGRLCRGRRDKVILCTKAGLHVGPLQQIVRAAKPLLRPALKYLSRARQQVTTYRKNARRQCFDAGYVQKQFHGSLRRLRTDYVDVFLLHSPPPTVLDDESLLGFLQSLLQSGLARHVGISCAEPSHLDLWLKYPLLTVFQVQASLWKPDGFSGPIPRAHAAGAGLIFREVLHQGFTASHPEALSVRGRSVAELAIQYLVDRSPPSVILCGMGCRKHLRTNLAAVASNRLSANELGELQHWQSTVLGIQVRPQS